MRLRLSPQARTDPKTLGRQQPPFTGFPVWHKKRDDQDDDGDDAP
jgi:hypothetical protein